LQQVWSVPRVGTFWSLQLTNQPPMPFLPDWFPQNTPVYLVSSNGVYLYDDRNVDYKMLNAINQATMSVNYPPGPGEGGFGGSDTNTYPPNPQFGPGIFI